jgi:hypothetical protein
MNEEHRQDHRYQVTVLAGAEALGAKQELIINDLSAHGFKASIKNKVKVDDIVELELTIHPDSKKQIIKMRGRVTYAKQSSYGQSFGAAIESWGSDDQKAAYLDYILEISQEE